MQIELILVPFDVASEETPLARSPLELEELGLSERLKERGAELWIRRVGARHFEDEAIRVASVARSVARRVTRAASRGRFPLVVSGGCLTAVGVALGLQGTRREFSTLWFDAHGDFNTPETTPSGYWDGMALAALSGRSLAEVFKAVELSPVPCGRIVHVGGRALDTQEAEDFARLSVLRIGPEEIVERWTEVGQRLRRVPGYYLHLDLDAIDPADAPALRLPVPEGLRLVEIEEQLRALDRPPLALTLSGMSFEDTTPEQAERQLDLCLRVVSAAISPARHQDSAPQSACL